MINKKPIKKRIDIHRKTVYRSNRAQDLWITLQNKDHNFILEKMSLFKGYVLNLPFGAECGVFLFPYGTAYDTISMYRKNKEVLILCGQGNY